MVAKTHDAFALASLATVALYYPPESLNLYTLVAAVVANNIGALIPDMDSAGNRLWDLLPAGDHVGKVFRRIFYKHRTLSHSLIGAWLVYKLLAWVLPQFLNPTIVDSNIVLASIMIGYVSHLIGDALTEEGIPLLFPIPISFGFPPIRKMRMKTGKWFEKLIVYPAIWIYLFWLIEGHRETYVNIIKLVQS